VSTKCEAKKRVNIKKLAQFLFILQPNPTPPPPPKKKNKKKKINPLFFFFSTPPPPPPPPQKKVHKIKA